MKFKQVILWTVALLAGGILGSLGIAPLDRFMDFVASAYTRAFQFVAIPTVSLAILTALASLGEGNAVGKVFAKTFALTVFTSLVAAFVGLGLFLAVDPGTISPDTIASVSAENAQRVNTLAAAPDTVYGHILSAIPNNPIEPFRTGNVLPVVLISAALGIAIALLEKETPAVKTLHECLNGLQSVFFGLIRGLIRALPVGIVAFAAQLAHQMSAGVVVGSIGKYVLVVLAGNLLQFFVILPLFLLARRIDPLRVLKAMSPAVLMALFTKSSAATLPVTVSSAENNLRAKPEVARFVCPICCTINMNGCAAFILVTSLFVMQNGGVTLTPWTMLAWVLIACISAIGNAGVPMGCYFLTLSLMAGQGMPIGILGVILPVYAVIDMIETAENVWSDSCVCAMVDKDLA